MAEDQSLRNKTGVANNTLHFAFLPNNLTNINTVSAINESPRFRDAIAAKTEGNASFEKNAYNDAIHHYSRAIDIFEEMNTKSCDVALGVCYQNRATANAFNSNYVDAIADATKAIELNEHYSKAYYRRAACYYDQRNFYRALQDIMQACVLERFKNQLYNATAVQIVKEIDKDPSAHQWQKAYEEMDAASQYCEVCLKRHLQFVKNCGIFDMLRVPIPESPEHEPVTGYIRAMVGIDNANTDEIMAGCNEEIASKGQYLAQSYILKAYMNSVVIQSPATIDEDVPKDIARMGAIISDDDVPENIKDQARFCRANMYNRGGKFKDAEEDLGLLEEKYGNTGLFHVIDSCALFQFALRNPAFIISLEKCARLLPHVYELQFQVAYAKSNAVSQSLASAAFMISSLEDLVKRFPTQLAPRILLIGFYIEMDTQMANRTLHQTRTDFPDRLEEFIGLYGLLKPKQPACVDYFQRAIRFHRDDPNSLGGLFNYFASATFEYAKAIEVATKALSYYLKEEDFKDMWERRQDLLKRIISQKFWDKL